MDAHLRVIRKKAIRMAQKIRKIIHAVIITKKQNRSGIKKSLVQLLLCICIIGNIFHNIFDLAIKDSA